MTQTNAPRAWRPLALLTVTLAAMAALMATLDAWVPRLGLDLRGGTSITLTARSPGGGAPDDAQMKQAVQIIRDRVNGAGVAENEVTQQGSDNIVVAVPGAGEEEVIELVGQTAELRFRPVLQVIPGAAPAPRPRPTAPPTGGPSPDATPRDRATPQPSVSVEPSEAPSGGGRGNNAALTSSGIAELGPLAAPASRGGTTPSPRPEGSRSPEGTPRPRTQTSTPGETPTPTATPTAPPVDPGQPTPEQIQQLQRLDCRDLERNEPDDPAEPLLTCDRDSTSRFLLGPADVLGTDVADASAGIPQGEFSWTVQLDFTGEGADKFLRSTRELSQQAATGRNQFAIVLDGLVVSAPSVDEPIPGGQAQITGDFTQAEAEQLANVLSYGSLPLTFDTSEVTTVSATLGRDQLDKGLLAGAIGLGLVVLASLLYYRALGIVVVASLAVAAAMTYGLIVLLGEAIGFTLVLAGVVGLIVAIGITADSFVVFFERVRDEIRDGRSVRMAVEQGWRRARHTIIVSDVVSLCAAGALYVFAAGSVKGFAFALGLTTLVDLVVVFLFTKPFLALLASRRFFGRGHPLSGFDPTRIGAPATTVARLSAKGA